MTRRRNRSTSIVLSGAALALALIAATPSAAAPAAEVVSVDPARLSGLPAFIDGVMAQQIATREVAGAVVTVVSGGKVLFTKGYGYADIDRKIPVDGEKTLFRPGSVSKLFTWTALMQQVEKGRVKLDEDINTYLDFKIPATQSKPILVRDLFTHTPGFEDRGGITVQSTADFVPLDTFMKTNIPARVREPGVESSYSNYGSAIAGYIVQRVSGEAFPDYVDRHIFAPLGMTSATFREPLTGARAQNMALGYELKDGRYVAKPFELYANIMPAGSASATGPDMARFMLAHLADGKLGDARILKPETMKQMRETLHKNTPGLPGIAYGYLVTRESGPRLIGHGGNTADFHSSLILAPEADFGFFISTTGGQGSYGARTELQNAIIGRVFPESPAARWTGTSTPPVGAYRTNRRTYSDPPRPEFDIQVTAAGPHALTLESRGNKTYWEQIGPQLYEQVTTAREGGPFEKLAFYGPESDRKMSFSSQPHVLYRVVK
ncbi:serine hydrolase domain-containing protein [Sphingosinicella soli]|uniref:CubicO group peptidase (Beta-lactamase class C family) n=1 Tax=Sphingosinicella soli TaxID=333708 RepID=A0A7W7B2U0_9SPHN|nr:serine hydrolase domain-containing protein [Sphingosinicella soli]MBB4632058.1 CubicO group peptidase (beta-lactamase class C family) [Sphingosinicella soli]